MSNSYRVRVQAKVKLIYEVEGDNATDAKEEAMAMAWNGDIPSDIELIGVEAATIEKQGSY